MNLNRHKKTNTELLSEIQLVKAEIDSLFFDPSPDFGLYIAAQIAEEPFYLRGKCNVFTIHPPANGGMIFGGLCEIECNTLSQQVITIDKSAYFFLSLEIQGWQNYDADFVTNFIANGFNFKVNWSKRINFKGVFSVPIHIIN